MLVLHSFPCVSPKAIDHFTVKEGYSNMRIGCPIVPYQQICKRSSMPGIWQQRGTAAARGTSDAFHPAANLKPGNSLFLQHKAWCSQVRNLLHAGVRRVVCMGCLCSLSCAVSVPHSHFLSLQDEVAMEPLSIPVVLVTFSSFLVSQWIFHVACPWLSEHLIPAFLTLTHVQRTEWSSRSIFFY